MLLLLFIILLLLGQPKLAQVLIILALLGYIMELWPHKAPLNIGQVIVGDVENPSGVTRTSSTAAHTRERGPATAIAT